MRVLPDDRYVVPAWPGPPCVRVLSTTRAGGVSSEPFASFNLGTHVGDDATAVARNRALLREALPAEPLWLQQVHGTHVIDADADAGIAPPEADAAVTRSAGRVLCIMTADCLPVVLADEDGQVLGMAHAGWRGLADGVLENTVARMATDPARITAWLGPAIGGSAYEVGQNVVDAFTRVDAAAVRGFTGKGGGKYWCDLVALARQRLRRAGVSTVAGGEHCTFRDASRFFSFRRDGRTGRMATCAWIAR